MNICAIKSASRDLYFQQNLKILRSLDGEDVALRYRTVWVDSSICESDHLGSCRATVAFCDPPEFRLVPIRELEVYNADVTRESVTLFTRCGPFVDPVGSLEWRTRFRDNDSSAGSPEGKFVIPLLQLGLCPCARPSEQQSAWCSVVDNLILEDAYKDCFYFYNKGLYDESGERVHGGAVEVGKEYRIRVLSYNKHLAGPALDQSKPRVVTDEGVLMYDLSLDAVPACSDFEIVLMPIAPGHTRVELAVAGLGTQTSRIRFDVEAVEPDRVDRDRMSVAKAEDDTTVLGKIWHFYTLVKRHRADDSALLETLLSSAFDEQSRQDVRVVHERIRILHATERYAECASLFDELPDDTKQALSDEAKEQIIVSYCFAKHQFPFIDTLTDLDLTERNRWSGFRDMLTKLPPEVSAGILSSLLRKLGIVQIEDGDLADLFFQDSLIAGFERLEDIRESATWLLDSGFPAACYHFLCNRLSAMERSADTDVLRLTLRAGLESRGSHIDEVITILVSRLISSENAEEALSILRSSRNRIHSDDYLYLLREAASGIKDPTEKAYLLVEVAGLLADELRLDDAKVCLRQAEDLCTSQSDSGLGQMLSEERARVLRLEDDYRPISDIEESLRRVKTFCKDRAIAVVGGAARPALVDKLQSEIGVKVEWYKCSKSSHLQRSGSLISSIKGGTVALVIQLEWSGHGEMSKVASECESSKTPLVFVRGSNWETAVRRAAVVLRMLEHHADT